MKKDLFKNVKCVNCGGYIEIMKSDEGTPYARTIYPINCPHCGEEITKETLLGIVDGGL